MMREERVAFGIAIAQVVRDSVTPRTTDAELRELVEQVVGDDDEAEFIASCAKDCRNCPTCSEMPCGGCLAGGICDAMRCRCDDHDNDDHESEEADE